RIGARVLGGRGGREEVGMVLPDQSIDPPRKRGRVDGLFPGQAEHREVILLQHRSPKTTTGPALTGPTICLSRGGDPPQTPPADYRRVTRKTRFHTRRTISRSGSRT